MWFTGEVSGQVDTLSNIRWRFIEYKMSNEEKFEILSKQTGELFYYLQDNNALKENLNSFHFLNLNQDPHMDFVYEGYAGSENKVTIFYTGHSEGYFDKVFIEEGILYEITKPTITTDALYFKLLRNDPCFDCLGVKNLLTYSYNNKGFKLLETVSYTDGTEMVNQIEFNKHFKVLNPTYYLRSTPNVNNDKGTHNSLFGNVIAEYSAESCGKAIASKIDSTGRLWWLVMMKADESSNSIFEEKNGYYLGWMSSRYLEQL